MLNGIPILDFAPASLLGIAILLILTGRLVPKAAIAEKQLEADRWRLAYENEKAAREKADTQTSDLLEVAKTTNHMVHAMFIAADHIRRSGGADVVVPKD